ncbi:MAG: heme A synthase [Planctomycetota bacterium]|nr:MAG: heme A synthase [Planctomycetota bacterium]
MTSPHASDATPSLYDPAHRSLASWMGALFALIMLLVAVGGFVRLTGSGLSIPEWPFINGSLLPPFSEDGWVVLKEEFYRDQERLRAAQEAGAVGLGSLGRIPEDMTDFKVMFYIEWSHRALASIIGIIALVCMIVCMRNAFLWQRCGQLLTATVILIVGQAVLGGVLVKSGTSTHFLFMHLGTAAIIACMVIWALMRLLAPRHESPIPAEVRRKRHWSRTVLVVAMVITWVQIIFGALVAGSRGDSAVIPTWPLMNGAWIPSLWNERYGVAWNLLDNAVMLQWVHRWFAWVVVAVVAYAAWCVRRSPAGERQRLASHFMFGLLLTQMALGVFNVFAGGVNVLIALIHLVTGVMLLASLVVVYHDARYEQPSNEPHRQPSPRPADPETHAEVV